MLPLLRQIRSTAEAGVQRYSQYAQSTKHTIRSPHHVAELSLPAPEPLTPRLVALGVDEPSAQRVSSAMLRAALRLREDCESGFSRRRQSLLERTDDAFDPKFLSLIPITYRALYDKTIQDWASYLLDKLTPRIINAQRLHKDRQTGRSAHSIVQPKRPFNQTAIPILERAFEANAFPSRLDKIELALKCDMDYRQIHVWFQNRRSRSRKEGRSFSKQMRPSTLLEELENSVVETLLPYVAEAENIDDASEQKVPEPGTNVRDWGCLIFPPDGPTHAFPSPYPPLCSYDPFPMSLENRTFKTVWPRTPARRLPPRSVPNMDDLVKAFDSLSLAVDPSADSQASVFPKAQNRPTYSLRSIASFVTRCPPAPHPAFIRPSKPVGQAETSWSRAVDRRTSSGWRVRSPIASTSQHTLDTAGRNSSRMIPSNESGPRDHKRRLPRRVPHRPPIIHPTPGKIRDAGTSPFTRVPSDKSSVASTDASSDVDSPLSTPPSLVTELPRSRSMVPPGFQPIGIDLGAHLFDDIFSPFHHMSSSLWDCISMDGSDKIRDAPYPDFSTMPRSSTVLSPSR